MSTPATLSVVGEGRLAISGVLDYARVPRLLKQAASSLEAASDKAREVVVSLDGVERSDSAGVAMLVHWQRELTGRGGRLRLLGMPAQMWAIVEISGLQAILALEPSHLEPAGEAEAWKSS